MQPFTELTAIAAPLPMINVDTDMIIPKQFLRSIKRTGFGVNLFNDLRYDEDGNEINEFVLNKTPFRDAQILVTGENFGCGSSREHAPWALLDFGIRCVIAPSYADIFYNNCFKNGILPLILAPKEVDELLNVIKDNPEQKISVNLHDQLVLTAELEYRFEIDEFRKHCLINGLDDIGLTLEKESQIASYEDKRNESWPWL